VWAPTGIEEYTNSMGGIVLYGHVVVVVMRYDTKGEKEGG